MKKIFIILWMIFFSYNTLADEFTNKKEYTTKSKNITNIPKIMDFFSFFCPYCYEFKKKYNIKSLLEKKIDKNIKIQTYHVNFLGGKFSEIITKAWIIAQHIGIEEKVMLPIFKGIQETHTIKDLDSIKKIFQEEAGVSKNQFNSFWSSLTLNILMKKKNKEIKKCQLNYVPTMLINGKYVIDYSILESRFRNNFPQKYIKLIQFLIDKK